MGTQSKIIFDYNKASNPFSGLGRFCIDLGKSLHELLPKERFQFYTDDASFSDSVIRRSELDQQESNPGTIFHATHQESKLLPRSVASKFVITVHDLNFLFKYNNPFRQAWHLYKLRNKVKRADAIVFISEFTKKIFLENCKVNDRQLLTVIPNGNSLDLNSEPTEPDHKPSGKFIFSLGIITAKKNFHTLLPLLSDNEELSLVIAGENTGSYALDIMEMAVGLEVSDRIYFPGKISESEKLWFYMHCEAFVFPSLAEGFGLPVIEAMSCGKPVFLLRSSSLPEVGGDVAYYWEDSEPETMNSVFRSGMIHYNSSEESEQKIKEHASRFTWKKAASAYAELYDSL